MKKKKRIILILFIIILLGILGLILNWLRPDYYKVESRVNKIEKTQKKVQENILGWIRVQGTNIDYPVLDGTREDLTSTNYDYTWMLQNKKTLQDRTVIYGHNILNVSSHPLINEKTHTRFEQLMSFLYTKYSEQNKYIQFTIDGNDYLYKIYSVAFVKGHDDGQTLNTKERIKYIKDAKKRSYFDFDVDVNENDKLITLVTCTRFFGPTTEYSFKVEGRLVRKHEQIRNYKIKEKKEYQEIKKVLKEGEDNEQTI